MFPKQSTQAKGQLHLQQPDRTFLVASGDRTLPDQTELVQLMRDCSAVVFGGEHHMLFHRSVWVMQKVHSAMQIAAPSRVIAIALVGAAAAAKHRLSGDELFAELETLPEREAHARAAAALKAVVWVLHEENKYAILPQSEGSAELWQAAAALPRAVVRERNCVWDDDLFSAAFRKLGAVELAEGVSVNDVPVDAPTTEEVCADAQAARQRVLQMWTPLARGKSCSLPFISSASSCVRCACDTCIYKVINPRNAA